jgi:hypothetical protein
LNKLSRNVTVFINAKKLISNYIVILINGGIGPQKGGNINREIRSENLPNITPHI